MDSDRSLIARHRKEKPGRFLSVSGETMSDLDDNRLFDMLWHIFRARNRPAIVWEQHPDLSPYTIEDYQTPRKNARRALRKLRGWYYNDGIGDPYASFNAVG